VCFGHLVSSYPLWSFFLIFEAALRMMIGLEVFVGESGTLKLAKTPLQSKFFPAKFPFSKIQKKNLEGKILFC
jgi:hypothetical protein